MDRNINLNENMEIEKALKEFETKFSVEEQQKKEKVAKNPELSKLVQFVIKYSGGLIKSKKQANYVLIAFIFLIIGFSLFFFLRKNNKSNIELPNGTIIIYPSNEPPKIEKII